MAGPDVPTPAARCNRQRRRAAKKLPILLQDLAARTVRENEAMRTTPQPLWKTLKN